MARMNEKHIIMIGETVGEQISIIEKVLKDFGVKGISMYECLRIGRVTMKSCEVPFDCIKIDV